MSDSLEVQVLCAGINRHAVENVRVSRERISDLLGPEFALSAARRIAKHNQGIGGLGIELRKHPIRTPTS